MRKIVRGIQFAFVLLVILELLSRAVMASPTFPKYFLNWEWGGCDTAWHYLWRQRCKRTGDKTGQYWSFDRYDPVTGWSLRPKIRNMEFKGSILNSNSKGVRGIQEYDYQKEPGKLRILSLGDSYTFGFGVDDDETFSAYLQDMIPGSEVINMGVSGFGHDQMLLTYRNEGVKYNPDIVLIGYVRLDRERNRMNFRKLAKPVFELRDGRIALKNENLPPPEEMYKKEIFRMRIAELTRILIYKYSHRFRLNQKKIEALSDAIMKSLIREIKDNQSKPVIVYMDGLFGAGEMPNEAERQLFAGWEGEGAQVVFIRPDIILARSANSDLEIQSPEGGHFSAAVHQIIAGAIKRHLSGDWQL